MSQPRLAVLPNTRFRLDGGAMFGVVPKALWSKRHQADAENRIEMTTRLLYVESDGRRMLVDPGIGTIWNATFIERFGIREPVTSIEESLEELDTNLDQITDILLTHLHFDHLAGCFSRKENDSLTLRFPQATHHVQVAQWKWARQPSQKDRGSYIQEHLELLAQSGLLSQHEGAWNVASGVTAFTVDGHTPSQQLFRVESGSSAWVYGGDLFPLASHLQLPWLMAYDLEPLKTLQAKRECLEHHLAQGETLILGHDGDTLGGVVSLGDRYAEIAATQPAETRPTFLN